MLKLYICIGIICERWYDVLDGFSAWIIITIPIEVLSRGLCSGV
jgi:hypothetical protein